MQVMRNIQGKKYLQGPAGDTGKEGRAGEKGAKVRHTFLVIVQIHPSICCNRVTLDRLDQLETPVRLGREEQLESKELKELWDHQVLW